MSRRLAPLLAGILALAPLAGAAEFKDAPAQPEIPKIVPIGPGVVGATILPTAEVPGIQTALPNVAPTAGLESPSIAPDQAKPEGIAPIAAGVAPQLEAIAKPGTGTEASAVASANVTTILQGGKAEAPATGVVAASAGNAGPAPLAKADGAAKPAAPAAPAAPETKPKGPKAIGSMARYKATRFILAAIATHFGVVYSMPATTPALTQKLLETKAREAKAIYSDIDDTLTKWNTVLPRAQAENVEGVLAAGKHFAAITDRPDKSRPGGATLGALESFSSLHENKRAGLIVATNGGGKIYEYDKNGQPQLIYEEPALPEAERPLIHEAAEVVKSQLAANGTELEAKNPGGDNPYGHTLIFKGGTPEATVKKLAHIFEEELKSRGLDYEVEGRMAKDPKLPPYITFSKLNKSLAVKRIMEVKSLQGEKALGMGDSMYAPVKPSEVTGWRKSLLPAALKLGRALSGQDIPLTGNRTDANMEHGNPGMTMFSVGMTGDPRMADGWVLAQKGPDQSAQILIEAARKPKGGLSLDDAGAALLVAALIVGTVAIYALLGHAFGQWVQSAEQQLQRMPNNSFWPF